MKKLTIVMVLVFLAAATFVACKSNVGPSDQPKLVVLPFSKYFRSSVANTDAADRAFLCFYYTDPQTGQKVASQGLMTKVGDDTFAPSSTINIYTETRTVLWVTDGRRYDGKDDSSAQYVAREIYFNGALVTQIQPIGSEPWSGQVVFTLHNDGSITFYTS